MKVNKILSKAIAGVKLPTMMNIGSMADGKTGVSAFDQFIQLLSIEKLDKPMITPISAAFAKK